MNSQCNWGKMCSEIGLLVHYDLWGFAYGLSWRKALAGWHAKAVADIQNRGNYKAKAVGTSPNAARTNCNISPLVFIWFNDLASSQFLFQLFYFSWRAFLPSSFSPSHPLHFYLHASLLKHFFSGNKEGRHTTPWGCQNCKGSLWAMSLNCLWGIPRSWSWEINF